MTLLQQIQSRLKESDLADMVEKLGYKPSRRSKVTQALSVLLGATDVDAYFDQGYYDFKYDSKTLLYALCRILEIPRADCAVTIEAYEEKKRRIEAMKKPYIFVYTRFRRKSEPIGTLAALESKRRINIDKKIYLSASEEEIDAFIRNTVNFHYKWYGGTLPVWGEIRAYLYYDIEGKRTVYSPTGEIIEDHEIPETKATVIINHKTLIRIRNIVNA